MSHQVGFALSPQRALQRITLLSLAQANALTGTALVHSEGHWPGRQHPCVNRSCSRTVQPCALLCGEWAQTFQICIFGEGWFKRVPPPAPFIPPAFDVDIQNSCSVFKWTVWCWQMKVDLCSYTKGYFVVWISRLSEEALQKDNCPSFFEPCKITLLERVDVRIYTLLFFPVPF